MLPDALFELANRHANLAVMKNRAATSSRLALVLRGRAKGSWWLGRRRSPTLPCLACSVPTA